MAGVEINGVGSCREGEPGPAVLTGGSSVATAPAGSSQQGAGVVAPRTPPPRCPPTVEALAAGPPPAPGPGHAAARGTVRAWSPIPERRKPRKLRRRFLSGVNVLEGAGPPSCVQGGDGSEGAEGEGGAAARGSKKAAATRPQDQHNYRRLAEAHRAKGAADQDGEALLSRLPVGFAQDYFSAPAHAKLTPAAASAVQAKYLERNGGQAAEPEGASAVVAKNGQSWLQVLQMGFSVLVEGVGSKWRVLEAFADEVLLPWGAAVVRINGFDARLSLAECLRDVLEQLYPDSQRSNNSVESLAAAVRAARQASPVPVRPLCLVVHNLEVLPVPHQESLARLVASPGVHLTASVDSIWSPLCWNPRCLRDFNFCREEVHTRESYETEAALRYRGGLPAWCDPSATRHRARKASVGLVLRSLTNSHRELVQAMAQHQLEAGGRAGLSQSRLLTLATDRMIATNVTKLRSLLNELRDHEVAVQRSGTDGCTLFHLPVDDRALQCLAEGRLPEEESEGESEASGPEEREVAA
mmetsp:Transcript_144521/g.402670  ORF Transcript_144521/g.402670 Transcript_144521/m.402670 type:complete len:526 (-) Transcript_144521:234-1811(-)